MRFLEITPKEIERLDDSEFIRFMDSLIQAEANRVGIAPINVKITASHKKNVGDKGVDGRIVGKPQKKSRWLPSTKESVWQFRSGPCKPAELKREAQKSGVVSAVRQGATYCVAHGVGYSVPLRERREKAIEEGLERAGVKPRLRYFTIVSSIMKCKFSSNWNTKLVYSPRSPPSRCPLILGA